MALYNYDETAHVEIVILNPTKEYQKYIHLTLEALDKGLSRLESWEYPPREIPILEPATETKKGRIVVKAELPIIDEFGLGKNYVRCILSNKPPKHNQSLIAEYDRASHTVWVGAEPPQITRVGPSGGWKGDDGKKGTIKDLVPITDDSLDPIQFEIMPIWSDGDIWFHTKGARIGNVYESQPRAADSILYELIAEAFSERRLKDFISVDTQDSFDKDQVLQQYQKIEELRKKFLRACEKNRATSRD